MSDKVKKPKRKVDKVRLWATIVSGIVLVGFVCLVVGLLVMFNMLKDKPEVTLDSFQNQESTEIYDKNGNVIAELGMTIRENVSYDDLPNCLVDAFVAVEDSRFFSHNGFDISRFTKAFLENIKTMSFSQGGSTFTMQLVKNTYFVDDEAGINAEKKVDRKVQEIIMAMELENKTSKKNIFELYLNKLNFGGNRNIRGVEKAAEYYFDKSVTDLNIAESALLAGVINAPYAYNPFRNLEKATARRNQVLDLMNYHGYITDEECKLAKTIKVEDLLVDPNNRNNQTGEGIAYQAYVDAVISEVMELTNQDPYVVPMKIYTYMDPEVQELMDVIQSGDIIDYIEESDDLKTSNGFEFPDDDFEIASISVNNHTGEINAILGGRNYADGGELLLNHAIEQYKQPGSSIKPILDYALAFENLGWATSHVLVDRPIVYPGTSAVIYNVTGRFNGQVTLSEAVGNSLNTPAVQALQEVIEATSNAYVVEYLNSIGYTKVTADNFNIQFAIGGSDLIVSCKEMAGAQAMLMNSGKYITPHTISKIEYKNGKNPVTPTYTPNQAISEQAAYLTTQLLYSNVNGGYANMMQILREDYPVYAKTGTSDWGDSGLSYGIPRGAIKDSWNLCSTNDYTVATWIGYEKASAEKQSYILESVYYQNIQGKISNLIKTRNVTANGKPSAVTRPEGISSITHIIATYPYAAPLENMDEQFITTGLIATKDYKLVDPESVTISDMADSLTVNLSGLNNSLSITWPEYPDVTKTKEIDENREMDISLKRSDGSVIVEAKGKKLFDYAWVYGPIRYKADIKVNDQNLKTITSNQASHSETLDVKAGDKIEVCAYYGYDSRDMRSNTVCKTLEIADNDITFTLPVKGSVDNIKAWASRYGINLTIEYAEETSSSPSGTFTFHDANKTYINGEQITKKQSELYSWELTCTYYQQAELTISTDVSQVKPGDSFNINVNNSNVTWVVSDPTAISIDSNGNASVSASANGTVTIYATKGSSKSNTITIVISSNDN